MFIIPILFVQIIITNVLSRFKRKLTTTNRMSEDLDELFLSPIPGPTPVELQQCILFGFRRRLYPSQILEECRSAFGPFAPSAQYVAKWYQRFQDGLFIIDEHDEEWCAGAGAGSGQTPTTCSDYNDDDNDNQNYYDNDNDNHNDNDNDNDTLPLVLRDVGQHGDKDSNSYDDFNDGHDDDEDEDNDDGHVISYWHGYGYLGGKRSGMSISGLPPLPKSLSGFNKLLGSDSGLLSDVDAQQELESNNNNNNNNNNKENVCGNKLASQKVSDNKNNNNNSEKQISKENANDKLESVKTTKTKATATATTTTTATAITTTTTTVSSSPAKINVTGSTLDAQIATLRKEMFGLRQLDLSLLSQLWALNDSIQEFRTMIEEQDDEEDDEDGELDEQGNRRHSPTPSSYDSVSSEGGAEADLVMQAKAKRLGTIPKVITTQPKQQQQQQLKLDMKPVARMRSAPPPPPPAALMCVARKAAAPPRPT
ncbi:bromodomain and WD repeat-containing DDB_G0285837 isoform X3 [Drosophila innubila]|uniref:bromodomain and WD repeat-containing DDB_G0285837 isoform X3 n=1 Tax=Drosophila innubila TaxID=198719 RepID=UPI00148D904D|nr:bromodomain and WD repeat-containing DDB_G0285837 isoform X3 [Drosophila innubila]